MNCHRCNRQFRHDLPDSDRWNGEYRRGRLLRVLCPDCQTSTEDLEAQINEATLDYRAPDPFGRVWVTPKAGRESDR